MTGSVQPKERNTLPYSRTSPLGHFYSAEKTKNVICQVRLVRQLRKLCPWSGDLLWLLRILYTVYTIIITFTYMQFVSAKPVLEAPAQHSTPSIIKYLKVADDSCFACTLHFKMPTFVTLPSILVQIWSLLGNTICLSHWFKLGQLEALAIPQQFCYREQTIQCLHGCNPFLAQLHRKSE